MGLSVSPHYAHDIEPTRTPKRRVIFFPGPMLHKRYYTGTYSVMVKHLLFATAGFETPPPPILATKKRIEIHHDPGSPLNCEN